MKNPSEKRRLYVIVLVLLSVIMKSYLVNRDTSGSGDDEDGPDDGDDDLFLPLRR